MSKKYLAFVCVAGNVGVAAAAHGPQHPPPLALRQALEQYHSQAAPAPRQLSAKEREALRRLLREQAAPPPPQQRNPPPGP